LYSSPNNLLFGQSSQEECYVRVMWHIRKIGEAHTGFWWGDLMQRDHLEDLDLDVRIILNWIFKERIGEV